MLYFPPAKINLGLNITSKRDDGFHNLETVFYQIPLTDILEILPFGVDVIKLTGIEIAGNEADNLVFKALQLVRQYATVPPVYIHLHKIIPMGAGLGGGSSDATYTLKGLNEVFGLGLSKSLLQELAAQLGSDCSLFVDKQPQLGKGRGELLEPIVVNLGNKYLVVVHPKIHVSTKDAFSQVVVQDKNTAWADILAKSIGEWKDLLTNDFEERVFVKFPEIARVKQLLYEKGAKYASMSGSGSSVFGIFEKEVADLKDFEEYYVWQGVLN